ncbi:MAG: hypothetical protein HY914_20535 [Desulfomonile tiedjei]|nr:hypothetical protein [Desulfomonile tiedjei]
MANEQKTKSPEELGEAVGKKIEALFQGTFLSEETTQELDVLATFREQSGTTHAGPAVAPQEARTSDTIEIPPPFQQKPGEPAPAAKPHAVLSAPAAKPAAAKPAPVPKPALKPAPVPVAFSAAEDGQPFDDVAELIEALILNLEWEVTPEVIEEVADRFKELDSYFSKNEQARKILAMNYRVLQRFKRPPGGASHPSLVKMLQESLTVLKLMRKSPESKQTIDDLASSVNNLFKVISADSETAAPKPAEVPQQPAAPPPAPPRPPAPKLRPVPSAPTPPPIPAKPVRPAAALQTQAPEAPPGRGRSAGLPSRVGSAVRSLEGLSQSLAKIVAELRQEGELAGEEVSTQVLEQVLTGAAAVSRAIGDQEAQERFATLIKKAEITIHSLEEVSQRFSRILGVFRQGGDMSGEEIIRRLGMLEQLFSERLGQLAFLHKELSAAAVPATSRGGEGGALDAKPAGEGLLTMIWAGTPLAIPSSLVAALFPITKAQGEQFGDKNSIILGGQSVQRLPLRKPPASQQHGTPVPAWLLHLTVGGKEYFLLVDRSLGYRTAPEGVDLTRQTRVNFGATSFAILNSASIP